MTIQTLAALFLCLYGCACDRRSAEEQTRKIRMMNGLFRNGSGAFINFSCIVLNGNGKRHTIIAARRVFKDAPVVVAPFAVAVAIALVVISNFLMQ